MDARADTGTANQQDGDNTMTVRVAIEMKVIWRIIFAILLTLAALWAIGEAQSLVALIGMSFFFSLALQPAVLWLTNRYGWRRGSAVGVIYLGGFLGTIAMVLILIPAVAELATAIGAGGAAWLDNGIEWIQDTFNVTIGSGSVAGSNEWAAIVDENLNDWIANIFGSVFGIVTSGIGLIFNLATMAMFTFYFTADAPRFQRTVLGLLPDDRQHQVGWAWDQAIIQTGGYFYSRMILMVINGTGFFFTMVAVGMPVALALPLAVFGGFVSVFIPAIGTYIGGAIPILLTLAIQGLIPGLVVLGYVLIYQQIENYWLSPKISANTMSLNGAVAFGGALFGGAIAGPMGAFISLPVAALITALIANFVPHHEVNYTFSYDEHQEALAEAQEQPEE
ncbi:MAG: AI-2E family transporter [Actinomycetia bacterium]|nr:AI-2E family transporter [Actinomycetes bacterium]